MGDPVPRLVKDTRQKVTADGTAGCFNRLGCDRYPGSGPRVLPNGRVSLVRP